MDREDGEEPGRVVPDAGEAWPDRRPGPIDLRKVRKVRRLTEMLNYSASPMSDAAPTSRPESVSLVSIVERQVAIERKLDTLIELLGAKPRPKEWY